MPTRTDDEDWLYRRAPQGAAPEPARRGVRRRSPWRWFRLAAIAFVAFVVIVPLLTWPFVERVDATPTGERPSAQPGRVYVLAGSDSREDLSPEEQAELGTGQAGGRRADTIMLLAVPTTGPAALVSIPRDSYVSIPGRGKAKINAAYAIGGPSLLVATVEQNTGLRVDGYAEVGFDGFVAVVDAVGGIRMCPPEAIKDPASNLDIPAGCQTMDGATALGYVRMRKADPRGDLGRVERQREMLAALAGRVVSPWTVLNPVRYARLHMSAAGSVELGKGDGVGGLFGLAWGALQIGAGRGLTLTVPISNPDARTSAGSVVLWDADEAEALFDEIARGDTSQLDRFAK